MKQFILRIGAVRLALIVIIIIGTLVAILTREATHVAVIFAVGFASTTLIGLAEIVDAIRESGININHIKISVDDSLSKAIRNEVLRDQAKALADLEAEIEAMEQADRFGEPDTDEDTDEDDEVEESREEDKTLHRPLTEAPEDGTLVYLRTMGEGKNIVPTPYAHGYHYVALREGRIFATREDALVCLYGDHYSTLKPEDEIGRGTLPSEYQD